MCGIRNGVPNNNKKYCNIECGGDILFSNISIHSYENISSLQTPKIVPAAGRVDALTIMLMVNFSTTG